MATFNRDPLIEDSVEREVTQAVQTFGLQKYFYLLPTHS